MRWPVLVLIACCASAASLGARAASTPAAAGKATPAATAQAPAKDPTPKPAAKPGTVTIMEPPISDPDKRNAVRRDAVPAANARRSPATASPAGKAGVSMPELARRIDRILQGQAPQAAVRPARRKAAVALARPDAASGHRLVWDGGPPEPVAVRLAWDYDLDPRYAGRRVPSGVRLAWTGEPK